MMPESTPNDCYSRVKSPSMAMSDSHQTHPTHANPSAETNSYANYNSNYNEEAYLNRNSHVPEPQVGQYPTSQPPPHHPHYQNSSDIQANAGPPAGPSPPQSGPHNPSMKGQPPVSVGGWPPNGPTGPPNMNNVNEQPGGPPSGPPVSAGQIQSSDTLKSKMAYMQHPTHPGPVMGPQPGQHPGLHGAQHSPYPQQPQYHSPHPQYQQQSNQMYNRYHQPLGPPNAPPGMPGMGPPIRGPNSGINYNNSNMNVNSNMNSSSMSPMTQNNASANNANSSVRYPGQPIGPTPTLNQLLQSPNNLQRYPNSYGDYPTGPSGPVPPGANKDPNLSQQQQQWNSMRFNQQQQLYRNQVSLPCPMLMP